MSEMTKQAGRIGHKIRSSDLISKLFFTMLPVQILIFAMGSINTIVDGAMAGRFIDSYTVGVVGMYFPMVNLCNAVSSVMLGGTAVLCGRYLGRGDLKSTNGIFSLNLTVTFIIGAVLTLLSFVIPGPIASLLGANDLLRPSLVTYIRGFAFGIMPLLLSQQLASFLQMERQSRLGYTGITGMIVSNVVLDVLLVAVFHMGVWGLALATSLSNWIYFLILVQHYVTKKAQLEFSTKNILWSELKELVRIGLPGALLVFCLSLRVVVLNRILLTYSGTDGLSAMSAYNMVAGLFMAYCLGNGAVVRMLISVFAGEEDKSSMKKVVKIALTKGLLLSCVVGLVTLIISSPLAAIFFPDRSTEVYKLTHQLFMIFAVCIPMIQVCQVVTNYMQATGHIKFVNFQSIFDGFFAMVIPAAILAPSMGALGVWLANPIGIILTLLSAVIYECIYWKHFPLSIDEWLMFNSAFGVSDDDCIEIPILEMDDVSDVAFHIQEFCIEHGLSDRTSNYSALCLEEMAAIVVSHGFTLDKKHHSLFVRVVYLRDKVILRLKDDCQPFDPVEFSSIISGDGKFDSIGIRLVNKIADEVTYQNLLGLNVLTITIIEENLGEQESTDFLLERKLRELDPVLHRRFQNAVFACTHILTSYQKLFPEYTDHSELHSLTVIDSCNRLIGTEQVDNMNKNEIFVLLMAAYLHDSGMGINEKDYEEFKDKMNAKEYFEKHPDASTADFVREYHNEFSGLFIDKYADFFELPSPEFAYAIKQVSRGHRRTDLYDDAEYPVDYKMPDGTTVCLPYLAALIRLTDEIDVAASRNPLILFDIGIITDEVSIQENRKLMAVDTLRMTKSSFILNTETDDADLLEALKKTAGKMQETLSLCRDVVNTKTKFRITQKKIILMHHNKAHIF